MELNREIVLKNYEDICKDIEKFSPYPEKVKILFVTKYFNIEEHRKIVEMGFNYFGENKAQVFRDKLSELNKDGLKWDFIGRLQKNKIKYIMKNVNLIHSVDSLALLLEIDKKAQEARRNIDVLIQVKVSDEEAKAGFEYEELDKVFNQSMDNVSIKGLMTMAPLIDNKEELRSYFRELAQIKEKLNKKHNLNLEELSMGMSNDYEEALKEGATIIRIGSRLFV